MTNIATLNGYTPAQITTIKNTVAKDHTDLEFDFFMQAAKSYKLDPFRKQIFSLIYNKDNAQKRKQTLIVSRDGCRVLANRCGDYRPADEPAKIEYDESLKGPTNPKGIVSATVKLWKQDKRGEWYGVIGQAYWDEFAPIKERWDWDPQENRRKPTGEVELDQSGQWAKMPLVMITKCAESQALRAGWPEQFVGLYQEEEMQSFETSSSASEMVNEYQQEQRQAMIGGRGIMFVFDDSATMTKVPMGEVFDRCAEFIAAADPEEVYKFRTRNSESLKEFWAHDKPASLELKKLIEGKANQFNPASEVA